ncbi:calmodulin-like protein 5 [Corylus avellana]|uniref:calmodulin-like protein 5 n=1 Tax=Corylus avellana TaxID=13451 RepID=UPI001E21A697|nr:calmodulin-like protein 5 [Corylus avellana]
MVRLRLSSPPRHPELKRAELPPHKTVIEEYTELKPAELPPQKTVIETFSYTTESKKIPPTEEVLRNIFKKFDANRDGRLSKEELTDAFRYLGSRTPGWRAGRALRHVDANGDGFVSEEELSELVKYAKKYGYSV